MAIEWLGNLLRLPRIKTKWGGEKCNIGKLARALFCPDTPIGTLDSGLVQ